MGTNVAAKLPLKNYRYVLGHEAFVNQCLSNLIDNALKFVPAGVTPQLRICSEATEQNIKICVIDNGIGIDPCHSDRIFRIFGRIHSDKTFPGTGIGLAIVSKAVARMGGTVGFTSEPGKGSTFWISLKNAGPGA